MMEFWNLSSSSLPSSSSLSSHNIHLVANRQYVFERSIDEMQQQQTTNQDMQSRPLTSMSHQQLSTQELYTHHHNTNLNNNTYPTLSQLQSTSICLSETESQSSSTSSSLSSSSDNQTDLSSPPQSNSESSPYWTIDGTTKMLKRSKNSTNNNNNRRHRRHNHHHHHHQHPHQRHAANLRERKRMQSINDAFEGLRARIPTLPYEKRLSKVDTLRLAIGYIRFLADLVRTGGIASSSSSTSSSATIGSMINGSVASAFHNRYQCCPPPAKKILVKSHLIGSNGNDPEKTTIHSLSWESDENKKPGAIRHGNILIAKVWTPEDPREASTSPPTSQTNHIHTNHHQREAIEEQELSDQHNHQTIIY